MDRHLFQINIIKQLRKVGLALNRKAFDITAERSFCSAHAEVKLKRLRAAVDILFGSVISFGNSSREDRSTDFPPIGILRPIILSYRPVSADMLQVLLSVKGQWSDTFAGMPAELLSVISSFQVMPDLLFPFFGGDGRKTIKKSAFG